MRACDLISPASFWLPEYAPSTAWIEHAPFAFWLVDALRPRTVVELGVHHGYSYFCFCQAIARIGYAAQVFGIDTFVGDSFTDTLDDPYTDDVYRRVSARNDAYYAGFSTIVRSTFHAALDRFPDGSIDLLHVDGSHAYADIEGDLRTWWPKLMPTGIVLMHDTNVRHLPHYEVWRVFDIARSYVPAFDFLHCAGLGVLGATADVPRPLVPLLYGTGDLVARVRYVYACLGSSIERRVIRDDDPAAVASQLASVRDYLGEVA